MLARRYLTRSCRLNGTSQKSHILSRTWQIYNDVFNDFTGCVPSSVPRNSILVCTNQRRCSQVSVIVAQAILTLLCCYDAIFDEKTGVCHTKSHVGYASFTLPDGSEYNFRSNRFLLVM